jgi:hypothetical protein
MDTFITYMPLTSVAIITGLFIMALGEFFNCKEKYADAKSTADENFEIPKRAADIF